jgi:hypothetical protein
MKITSEIQGQFGMDVPLAEWNKLAYHKSEVYTTCKNFSTLVLSPR